MKHNPTPKATPAQLQAAQERYDYFIQQSDIAYEGAQDELRQAAGLDVACQEKAKAYQDAASKFNQFCWLHLNIFLKEKQSKVRKAIEDEREAEYETIKAA